MEEIDPALYLQTLDELILQQKEKSTLIKPYQVRKKAADYAIRRGYEVPLAWERAKALIEEET